MQSTNALPFPFILANCVAWVSYALVKQDIFVFLANEAGVFMGMFFTLSAYGVANPQVSLVSQRQALQSYLLIGSEQH